MMNLITTADCELFTKAIGTFKGISISYFVARKEFKSSQDSFLIYLCETLNDLVKLQKEAAMYYTRSLFTAIREISLSTLSVDVIGSQSGYNYLATPLARIMKERAVFEWLREIWIVAYDPTYYGHIGCALAYNGFGHSAVEIAEGLKEIATYCHAFKDTVTLVPVRNSLATIFIIYCVTQSYIPITITSIDE